MSVPVGATSYAFVQPLPRVSVEGLPLRKLLWLAALTAEYGAKRGDAEAAPAGLRLDRRRLELVGSMYEFDEPPMRAGDYVLCFTWPLVPA